MIEFRAEKGWYTCTMCLWEAPEGEFKANAKAIVEDGIWYYEAACDNEAHIAEALSYHAHLKARGAESMPWNEVPGRTDSDYIATLEGS